MNILVTDSDYKHSLGIVRHLGKEGYKSYVLSFNKSSLCSYSKYVQKELVINKDYNKEDLLRICKEYKIQLIILVGTNSFRKIVPWKKDLKKEGVFFISVDEGKLNLAFSKKETYQFAERIGIPVPKTIYPKSFNEVENCNIGFPCVIKGLYEVGGNIVDYACNKKELIKKYTKICEQFGFNEEDQNLPMIQEYIEGFGCAFFAIYNKGKCGLTFQHRRIREYPPSGGASVCAESFRHRLVEEFGRRLLDSLKWHGVAMVEFRMTENGIPVLMEINPKFWGSLDLALEAGVNFPKTLVDIYLGEDIAYSNNYKFIRYHWPLDGDFLHAIHNPRNAIDVLIDCLNPKVKSNIWLRDPLPTLKRVYELFKAAAKKIL